MNMNQIMQQAQAMQKKMEEMQKKLESTEYEGKSGGDAVKIMLSGKFNINSLNISEELLKEGDAELISDLVIAAFNDAKTKVEDDSKNSMSGMFGGMKLPAGFKMPF